MGNCPSSERPRMVDFDACVSHDVLVVFVAGLCLVLQKGCAPQCACHIFIDLPFVLTTCKCFVVQFSMCFAPVACQTFDTSLHLFFGSDGCIKAPRPHHVFGACDLNAKGKLPHVGQFGVNRFFR